MFITMSQYAYIQSEPYQISMMSHESGMYFENQGSLRLTNSDWKFLVYIKLNYFNLRTLNTIEFYNKTLGLRNKLASAYRAKFEDDCKHFRIISSSLEKEVFRKRFFMLQSIDESELSPRVKRGLINLVGNIQKTLFGTLDNTDAELYNKQIEKLQISNVNILRIIKKQTSILRTTENTFREGHKMQE